LAKNSAPRNRSIELLPGEEKKLKSSLLKPQSLLIKDDLLNRIINLDIFAALDLLPDSFIDLLFLDPPYNIYKKFNSGSFKIIKSHEYETWMESWMKKLVRLLKPDASVYICGDWSASNALPAILLEFCMVLLYIKCPSSLRQTAQIVVVPISIPI
jgi:site-specific DNA-methyltransferase (adenine-specific)